MQIDVYFGLWCAVTFIHLFVLGGSVVVGCASPKQTNVIIYHLFSQGYASIVNRWFLSSHLCKFADFLLFLSAVSQAFLVLHELNLFYTVMVCFLYTSVDSPSLGGLSNQVRTCEDCGWEKWKNGSFSSNLRFFSESRSYSSSFSSVVVWCNFGASFLILLFCCL